LDYLAAAYECGRSLHHDLNLLLGVWSLYWKYFQVLSIG
jgi:hypothetical protein